MSSSLLPLDNFITIDSHWHPFDQSQLCIDQLDSVSPSCRSPTPKRPPSPDLASPTRKKPKHDPLIPSPSLSESELQDLLADRQTGTYGDHQLCASLPEPASTKSSPPATCQTRPSQLEAQETLSPSPSPLDHQLLQPSSPVHPHDDAPKKLPHLSSSQPDSTRSSCGSSSPSVSDRHPRTASRESPPIAPLRPRRAPARTPARSPARSRRRSSGQHQLLRKTSSLEFSDCKDTLETIPSDVLQQNDPTSQVDSPPVPDFPPKEQQTRNADVGKCDGLGELSDDLGLGPSGSLFSSQNAVAGARPPSKLSQRFSTMSKKATTATSTKYQPETSTSSVFRPPKRNRHKANEEARIVALTRRHTAINEARVCVLKIEVQHMGRARPPSPGPRRRYMGTNANLSVKRGGLWSEGDEEKEDEIMALGSNQDKGNVKGDSGSDGENGVEDPKDMRKVRWGNPIVVDSHHDDEDFEDLVQEQQQLQREQREEVLEKRQEETDEDDREEEITREEVENEKPKRKSILVNKVKLDEDGNVLGKKIDSKISPEFIVVKRRLWKR